METSNNLSISESMPQSDTVVNIEGDDNVEKYESNKFISKLLNFLKRYKPFIISITILIIIILIILFQVIYYLDIHNKTEEINSAISKKEVKFPKQIPHFDILLLRNRLNIGAFIVSTLLERGYPIVVKTEIEIYKEFDNIFTKYNNKYSSLDHMKDAYINFHDNYEMIKAHNATLGVSFKMSVNQFSEISHTEFKREILNNSPIKTFDERLKKFSEFEQRYTVDIPNKFSWQDAPFITVNHNQYNCASHWAFTTAGAIQANYFIKRGLLFHLSPQELLDCDTKSSGCQGGDLLTAIEYVTANGLCFSVQYPYKARQGQCEASKCKNKLFVDDWKLVKNNFEYALFQGSPIIVLINADDGLFKHYSSGIFDGKCTGEYGNHYVLLVGYGIDEETKKKYWIIKNSWGKDWGENGFAKILRSDNFSGFDCHFAGGGLMPV